LPQRMPLVKRSPSTFDSVPYLSMSAAFDDREQENHRRSISTDRRRMYALGYSESKLKRLELQANFFRDLTEDVLRRAGIASGMRVLDIGCGVGDVSLLAAELVGPSGAVLGVDRSAEAIEMAVRRAAAAGQHWVRFAGCVRHGQEVRCSDRPARSDVLTRSGRELAPAMPPSSSGRHRSLPENGDVAGPERPRRPAFSPMRQLDYGGISPSWLSAVRPRALSKCITREKPDLSYSVGSTFGLSAGFHPERQESGCSVFQSVLCRPCPLIL
jgi:Methyltransferase domain